MAGIQTASSPQPVVKSAVSAAPFLDGLLHLHTPPDILDVLRPVAVDRDTHWIPGRGHAGVPCASCPPPVQRVFDIHLEVREHEISTGRHTAVVDCLSSKRCTAVSSARTKSSDCAQVLATILRHVRPRQAWEN